MKSPKMVFEIRNAANGLIVESHEDDGETKELVYQEVFDEDQEHEVFAAFLRELEDHFGPAGSKWSEKRIRVVVRPGNDYPEAEHCFGCGEVYSKSEWQEIRDLKQIEEKFFPKN